MSRSEPEEFADRKPFGRLSASLSSIAGAVRSGSDSESSDQSRAVSDGGSPVVAPEDGSGSDAPAEVEIPEETLFRLVVDNGGRMRQADLVEVTSWSPARVSRRLKNLESAGWIRRVRQGRENVVFVPPAE